MHPLKQLISNSGLMESLAKEYGTPLYVYDANRIINNVNISFTDTIFAQVLDEDNTPVQSVPM